MKTTIVAPTEEPIDEAAVKLFGRIDTTTETTVIETMIKGARAWAETFTRRAFVSRTIDLHLPCFPGSCEKIELTPAPLRSVTGVYYIDANGTEQTVDPATYDTFMPDGEPGYVIPKKFLTWPDVPGVKNMNVRVRFIAGYGDADAVPEGIKQALLMLASDMYNNRETKVLGTIVSENRIFEDMLFPYKVW